MGNNEDVKIGDMYNIYHRGQVRTCRVIKEASKRSSERGERWVWLEVVNKDGLDEYYYRVMKPARTLGSDNKVDM